MSWVSRILQIIGIASILIGVWTMGALWAVDAMLDEYETMEMLLNACQQEMRL